MSKLDTLNEHNPWQVGEEFMKLEEVLNKIEKHLEFNAEFLDRTNPRVQTESKILLSWIKNWKGGKL